MKSLSKAVLAVTLIVTAAVVAVGSLYPAVRGWVPLTVLTGSMVPSYDPGDLIVVEPLEAEARQTPQVDDVVSFYPRPDDLTGLTTHRIVDRIEASDGVSFITQGDANEVADPEIMAKQVAGVVRYSVPKLGFLAQVVPSEAKPAVVYAGAGILIIMGGFYGVRALRPQRKEEDAMK